MRRGIFLFLFACAASAQEAASPAGKWISDLKFFQENNYQRLELSLDGTKLSGKLGNNNFEGVFQDGRIEGTVKPNPQQTIKLQGLLQGDRIEGSATMLEAKVDLQWEVRRESPAGTAPPKTHTFEPTEFHHFFSDAIAPALHLNSGDTVKTWSVDAGGTDPKGVRRTSGGNPLTGPFYIDGAWPGDTLVIHFNRIRLNRDTAISSPLIVNSALNPGYVEQRKRVEGYNSNWKLDRAAGFASLQQPTETMKEYRMPLAPMLGCVGVAPAGAMQYRSGFLGSFGGNMDYNQLREGVTVYLPVYVPRGPAFCRGWPRHARRGGADRECPRNFDGY
jgi:amidase